MRLFAVVESSEEGVWGDEGGGDDEEKFGQMSIELWRVKGAGFLANFLAGEGFGGGDWGGDCGGDSGGDDGGNEVAGDAAWADCCALLASSSSRLSAFGGWGRLVR